VCGVRDKHTVEVPDKYAGLVIGKGGNTIKDIMQRTGCKLNMSQRDETSTTGTRTCNFRGSPPQVQAAKILVNEIIVGAETVTALYITVARRELGALSRQACVLTFAVIVTACAAGNSGLRRSRCEEVSTGCGTNQGRRLRDNHCRPPRQTKTCRLYQQATA
jgi:hypothetical protein